MALNRLIAAIVIVAGVFAPRAGATDVTPHSVIAHANDQQFWVGRIDHVVSLDQTIVYYRLVGQDDKWQKLCQVPARIDQIASQGPLAAALLADGSWLLLYSDGSTVTAGPLPASAKMVALAGEKSWWAVGEVAGGIQALRDAQRPSSTTQPATQSATTQGAVSSPSTQPASSALVLFELSGNDWTAVAQLPAFAGDVPRVDLCVIDGVPHVVSFDHEAIDVLHLEKQKWIRDMHLGGMSQTAAFALLTDGSGPRLWVQQQSGPDLLYSLANPTVKPLELKPTTDIPAKDRTLALFSGSIRMIARSQETFVEQRFSLDTGKPEGKPANLAFPPVSTVLDIQSVQTLVAIGALLVVMLGWFRQQSASEQRQMEVQSVTLAPLGRRLLAGLIDASPVILTMIIFMVRDRQHLGASIQSRQLMLLLAYWASSVFYIIFTTLIESMGGRSLGKILLGLRVATTEGKPPTAGALVVRNLLRIFDVSLFFLPVLAVAMFPLRQRAGDLAAGTLVIVDAKTDGRPEDGPPPG